MATVKMDEIYTNAVIDASDMTITEYNSDSALTYSLLDLIGRWDGIGGVSLHIQRIVQLPPDMEGEA